MSKMVCGNKEHEYEKKGHACGLCKYCSMEAMMNRPITEICIKCKSGDCQWIGDKDIMGD